MPEPEAYSPDPATIDDVLAMLDTVEAEYHRELTKFGPTDPFEINEHRLKTATVDRIRREIIVLAGRLPSNATF